MTDKPTYGQLLDENKILQRREEARLARAADLNDVIVALQSDLDIIHNFMREHLDERITLNQLADLTGLSPAHFATRYRALTGVSPIQHFLHLKVEQACQLLDTTDHSFTQISSLLGYDDNYYFSRLFKKVMGQSPTDYRHTHRH
jgi:AraC-like DNA-binding protein